ncbi:MAG: c-type cytochrome [Gammaproteobacteria bacterium]|nr:c-type cytochrome [Gammaproteobacteria bacterium]
MFTKEYMLQTGLYGTSRANRLARLTALSLALLMASATADTASDVGSAEQGKGKAAICQACHGDNGISPNPAQWPHLAGQGYEYMLDQLVQIRDGGENARRAPLMAPLIQGWSDQDLADVAQYYAQFPRVAPSPAVADQKILTLGRNIYRGGVASTGTPACMACHGPQGRGNPKAKFPAVTGQHADYNLKQLKYFRSGERPGSAVMTKAVLRLTDPELRAVSLYLQSLY